MRYSPHQCLSASEREMKGEIKVIPNLYDLFPLWNMNGNI